MEDLLTFVPELYRPWLRFAIVLAVALAVAWVLHLVVYHVATHVTNRTVGVADTSAVRRTRRPARVLLLLLAVQVVLPTLPAADETTHTARHLVSLGVIASVTWLIISVVNVVDDVILARYDIDARDNLEARRVHTQTRVLSRTVMIIIGGIGFAAAMMTFPSIRQIGASMLASAGIVGLVVGLAARPTIGNLIAGLQIAMTQPIRLDDVVIMEGEWGRIEEITSTYVVVRIWDQRRLIVPLQHVIEQPFQNWTRSSADILGTVFIYTDYTVPVEKVRAKLREIAGQAEQWDERVCVLQVTDATEQTMQLRALVSASDAGQAWELRCYVREKLLEYLQQEFPDALPRTRAELEGPAGVRLQTQPAPE